MECDIQTLEVIKGELPRRAQVMVLEWANERRAELMEKGIGAEAAPATYGILTAHYSSIMMPA